MKILQVCRFIATLGPIGHMTASGTVASIVSIPFMFWLRLTFQNNSTYGMFVVCFSVISLFIIRKTLQHIKRVEDPSEIVLDEVVGCLITFWTISLSVQSIIIGLMIFRFFDILKLGIIRYAEKMVDEWGIILDDVIAALITNLLLRVLF